MLAIRWLFTAMAIVPLLRLLSGVTGAPLSAPSGIMQHLHLHAAASLSALKTSFQSLALVAVAAVGACGAMPHVVLLSCYGFQPGWDVYLPH